MATPIGTEFEAERARLRAKGATEAEISQILIAREVARSSPQAGGSAPVQGNMTGVLGNASAAVSYGQAAIFGIRGDIRSLANHDAPALERAMSGGILAFKLVVVAVVCFAIYQEWQQHIISATARAAADAARAQAESRIAQETAQLKIEQAKWEMAQARAIYGNTIGRPMPEDVKLIDDLSSERQKQQAAKPTPDCPPNQKYVPLGKSGGCYDVVR